MIAEDIPREGGLWSSGKRTMFNKGVGGLQQQVGEEKIPLEGEK